MRKTHNDYSLRHLETWAMFLNDLRLGVKLFGGFSIVLILTVAVAFAGYYSLTGVAERVGKANDVDSLARGLSEARQLEKDYMLRSDKAYAAMVDTEIKEIISRANRTKSTFQLQANQEQMDLVIGQMTSYLDKFLECIEVTGHLADDQLPRYIPGICEP